MGPGANLSDANLRESELTRATFSTSTILNDNQTVLEHDFDAAGLQAYLVKTLWVFDASDLSIVLSGDFNDDNTVDLADLNLVLFNWNQPADGLPSEWTIMRPSNNVGLDELNQVLFNWGETTIAPSVVPEPGTVSLAAIAGLLMLCGRSRRLSRR